MKGLVRAVEAAFNRAWNHAVLRLNRVEVGRGVRIHGRIIISNRGRLVIGDGAVINSGLRYNPVGGHPKTVLMVYSGGELHIGPRVGISNCTIIARREIRIDEDAMIGSSTNIWDTDFHSLDPQVRGTTADHGAVAPVHIGCQAFIGAHSILLKGSSVGARAVVGAGSVGCIQVPADGLHRAGC